MAPRHNGYPYASAPSSWPGTPAPAPSPPLSQLEHPAPLPTGEEGKPTIHCTLRPPLLPPQGWEENPGFRRGQLLFSSLRAGKKTQAASPSGYIQHHEQLMSPATGGTMVAGGKQQLLRAAASSVCNSEQRPRTACSCHWQCQQQVGWGRCRMATACRSWWWLRQRPISPVFYLHVAYVQHPAPLGLGYHSALHTQP